MLTSFLVGLGTIDPQGHSSCSGNVSTFNMTNAPETIGFSHTGAGRFIYGDGQVSLFVCLSACLPVCLSVCLSVVCPYFIFNHFGFELLSTCFLCLTADSQHTTAIYLCDCLLLLSAKAGSTLPPAL